MSNKGKRYSREKKRQKRIEEKGASVSHLSQEYTKSLLKKLCAIVNSNPRQGLQDAQDLRKELESYRNRASVSPDVRRIAACSFVSCLDLEATALRMLGHHENALELMSRADARGKQCPSCQAEQLRLRALFHAMVGNHGIAKKKISQAIHAYRTLGHNGHNLNDNGLASCGFADAHIKYLAGETAAAIDKLQDTITLIDPAVSGWLYGASLANLAGYLLEDDSRLDDAERLLDESAKYFYFQKEISVEQMVLFWTRGLIKGRKGSSRAEVLLGSALVQAQTLTLFHEELMILVDLMHFRMIRSFALTGSTARRLITFNRAAISSETQEAVRSLEKAIQAGDPEEAWACLEAVRDCAGRSAGTCPPSLLPKMKFL